MRYKQYAWAALGLLLSGCGGSGLSPVLPPPLSPDEAAKKAIAQYDTNHDGFLAADELERCPALKSGLAAMDKDKDGRLSVAEIAGRLQEYNASKTGALTLLVSVTLDGQPLPDATVTFVPESFLGPGFKPASGVTSAHGKVFVRTQDGPGVPYGMYRIEVSRKGPAGEELPARYNSQSELGVEIGPNSESTRSGVRLVLSSQ